MKNQPNHNTARGRERANPPFSNAADRRRLIAHGLLPALVVLLSVFAFLPALWNDFVNWDDYNTLALNPHYRGLGWTQLRWMFTTFLLGHYQPLSWITWGLDYLLWGMNPFGYHLTNLLLHAANAVLVYFIGCRLLRIAAPESAQENYIYVPAAAACAALLFAVHPLRVESVAWITERRDVLSAHFLFWTLICYLRAATHQQTGPGHQGWIAAALVFYLLSLLSKAWGITLPVLLCILDVYPLRRLDGKPGEWFGSGAGKLFVEKAPFVVLAVTFAVVAILAQDSVGALAHWNEYPLARRIAQALFGIDYYLWKTLWPVRLSPLYHFHHVFDPLSLPYVISGLLILALTAGFFLVRKRWPAGMAAWACYVVLLSPVLGIAQSGLQFVADRYSYLSCVSWALLAGAALRAALRAWGAMGGAYRGWLAVIGPVGLLLIALGGMTWRYTTAWRDSETLWEHAIAVNPRSNMAHIYLGDDLRARKKFSEAIEHYQRAVQIDPDFAVVYYHLAQAHADLGQFDLAIEYLRKHIQKARPAAGPHIDAGIYLSRLGRTEEEISEYRRALEIDPKSAEAYYGMGNALAKQGNFEEAKRHLNRAIELNPEKSEFFFSLGNLLVKQNLLAEATESFRRALRVKPDFPLAQNNLGRLLAAKGDLAGAMEHFREALRVDPTFAPGHESMAQVLAQLGRNEEAMEHYREALRLGRPDANPGGQP